MILIAHYITNERVMFADSSSSDIGEDELPELTDLYPPEESLCSRANASASTIAKISATALSNGEGNPNPNPPSPSHHDDDDEGPPELEDLTCVAPVMK